MILVAIDQFVDRACSITPFSRATTEAPWRETLSVWDVGVLMFVFMVVVVRHHPILERAQRRSPAGVVTIGALGRLSLRCGDEARARARSLPRRADLAVPVDAVRAAEDLGYHSVWTAEAYGTDALSPLAYLAALTTRIKLGTAVVQLAARPPATLAMHAMTIDALAGGDRVIVGLGVSGPQIVEGWYGQPWGKPDARLRDYVDDHAQGARPREAPVTHDGPGDLAALPRPGRDRAGQGAEVDPAPGRADAASGSRPAAR